MLPTFKKLPESKQMSVLKAAAKVFAKKGYYHANVSEICIQAQISNGALYKYFKNKEALYLSVFDYLIDTVVREMFLKLENSSGSIYETIHRMLEEMVRLAKNHPELVAIYVDVGTCSMNKISAPLAEEFEGKVKKFWMEIIRKGKQSGEIKESISSEGLAYFIDNHINLLAYSLVSTYYDTRFKVYFGDKTKKITDEEKINTIIKSIRTVIQ